MPKQTGFPQNFYVEGYDISGDVGAINTAAAKREQFDMTGIDKSAHERINAPSDGELSFATFFNPDSGAIHDALSGLPTADVGVMYVCGLAIGDPVAMLVAKQVEYSWERGEDGSLLGTSRAIASAGTPLEWGDLLTVGGKRTDVSITAGAGLDDNGAASAEGAVGYLQFFSGDTANSEIVIQDSATEGGAKTTLIAFAPVATPWNPTSERATVTGEVLRWLFASTVNASENVVFAVGVRRGTTVDDVDLS